MKSPKKNDQDEFLKIKSGEISVSDVIKAKVLNLQSPEELSTIADTIQEQLKSHFGEVVWKWQVIRIFSFLRKMDKYPKEGAEINEILDLTGDVAEDDFTISRISDYCGNSSRCFG